MTSDQNVIARRGFLQLLGAGLTAVSGCAIGPADERIVPYVRQSPESTPGKPRHYATTLELEGYARGVLVTTHAGRPTKIEGNPDHPASLGGSSAVEQAALLDLYNAGRITQVARAGQPSGWTALAAELARSRGTTAVILAPTTSPAVARFISAHPELMVAVADAPPEAEPVYDFSSLRCLATFDSDPTDDGPLALRYARALGDARRNDDGCRVYCVETAAGGMAAMADERRAVPPREVGRLLAALAQQLGVAYAGMVAPDFMVRAMARDLRERRGLVVVRRDASPALRTLAAAINAHVAPERTRWIASPRLRGAVDLDAIVMGMDSGDITTVVMLGGNPVATVPELAEAVQRAHTSVYCGVYPNATARAAHWRVPLAHLLESWFDLRAGDGTYSLAQPLVSQLYPARPLLDVLDLIADPRRHAGSDQPSVAREAVLASFTALGTSMSFEMALRTGCVPKSAAPRITPSPADVEAAAAELVRDTESGALELNLTRDSRVRHSGFAHNGWLLELPQPVTTLTWENAALLSDTTAAHYQIATGDIVRLVGEAGQAIELPALIAPGHADASVSVALGWGETSSVSGAPVGVDASPLLGSPTVQLTRTKRRTELPLTQHAYAPAREQVTRVSRRGAHTTPAPDISPPTLHDRHPNGTTQWGMAIDLNACTACGACVVACQAENNIPVVGRSGVVRNRHMHWLRIDTVVTADRVIVAQPMLCQHCEAAPCEYVCPVNATSHSPDGLNEMTYNRCVGTRFCSNNCPYKVRRFNWFDYTADTPPITQLAYNPDVTVRARGVMEKCTFCVQRLRRAGIDARIEGKPVVRDSVVTACAQACPTGAIVFGDLGDPGSRVSALHRLPETYGALAELGTRPRVRYLPRVIDEVAS